MVQLVRLAAIACVMLASISAAQAQWSNPTLFSSSGDTGTDVKDPKLCGSMYGGVHGVYRTTNNAMRYRRFQVGPGLGSVVTVHNGQAFNDNIAESLNGEIHIVVEDWAGSGPNVRWYKSTNGGASFTTTAVLGSTNCAKHPHISAYGTSGGEMLMTYYRSGSTGACDKSLYYQRYNGSSWLGEGDTGSNSYSEYDCFGMARSPLDGSVYRSFDPYGDTFAMRRYYAGSWGSQTTLLSGTWPVRQHMAINASGKIMWVWDSDDRIKSMSYTPGLGTSAVVDLGPGGYSGSCDVCAIPGTDDFYMVIARGGDNGHVYGRRWTAGAWQAEESVQNSSLPNAFITFPTVAADPQGRVYAAWEYWGSSKPQMWLTYRDSFIPSGPKGYLAGTVRDNYGVVLPNAAVTIVNVGSAVTNASGVYNLTATVGTHNVDCSKVFYTLQSVGGVVITENNTTTLDFTLGTSPPAQIAALTVTPGNQVITLNWTGSGSANFNGTRLRFSTTGYPTSPTDGQQLADVVGAPGEVGSYTHTGRTNGETCYYAAFAYFQDASRFYAAGSATATTASYGPGDFDHDGDVDQSDFAHFQACLTGNFNLQEDASCYDTLFDADYDTDEADLTLWQLCYSGPGVQANPYCH